MNPEVTRATEMKSSRSALPRDVAIPGKFDSFFSFPTAKGGYSGVAVYTDSTCAVPMKAEEGLSGRLQPKPPLSTDERVSPVFPSVSDIEPFPDEQGNVIATFDALDSEGRGLVVDFGLFVLINVYCPNETSDARLSFKMNYHLMLQERVRLLMQEGREVIVVGDLNICATPLDHCDGHLPSTVQTFYEHPARSWFQTWLDPIGPMIDVVRTYWPDRKGLYTCWNTKISARETNYGTRVDYILVTRGLLQWIKHGDIQPSLKGSDHCPIFIDLHDEITLPSGDTLKLRDAMKQMPARRDPPRLAATFWEEFSGKQTLLSNFFAKRGDRTQDTESQRSISLLSVGENELPPSQSSPSPSPKPAPLRPSASQGKRTPKRKTNESSTPSSSKKKKKDTGQSSIASFFGKGPNKDPRETNRETRAKHCIVLDSDEGEADPIPSLTESPDVGNPESQIDADFRLAMELASAEQLDLPPSQSQPPSSSQNKEAWSNLFTPVQPPKCLVHGEPAKKFTVNKPGPNKGRTFYVCSRPVGPGYDRGRSERLREEVNHEYKCNYFKWASDLKNRNSSGMG